MIAACGTDATAPADQTQPPEPPIPPTPNADPFVAGAQTAWTYVPNNTQASTGLAKTLNNFQFVTVWDIASQIGATYSAHALGIIDDANYDGRIKKILGTLNTMPLA